jgi:Tol biopolymer transport system component
VGALAAAAALVLSAVAGFTGAERFRAHERASSTIAQATAPSSALEMPAQPVSGTAGRTVAPSAPGARPVASDPGSHEQTVGRRATARPVRALPRDEEPAFSPAFSPNGTALFFQTGGANDATSAIAVAPAGPDDGLRIMKVIDDGARNYHAQPSPDGRSIAFDSDRDGVRGVYIASRDGSNVRRISGAGYAALPTWSPDGRRLTYVRAEPGAPAVWNLWLQPLNGGAPRRLTSYRFGQTWSASWFPDGRRIAYSHEDALTILDLESGREQRVISPIAGRLVRTPAVSPDGSRIVFQVFRAGAWILNLRDDSMECVLPDPSAEEFAWAPDGRRFAFHSRRDGEWGVYVLSASPAAP